MNALITIGALAPGALTVAEIEQTIRYAENEKAQATREAYATDWRDFSIWCLSRGATPLPAHVGIVAAYLSWLADSGRKSSTIGRRAAAIGYHHKMAGHEPPRGHRTICSKSYAKRRETRTQQERRVLG
jgi:site-specific recombinase XerD